MRRAILRTGIDSLSAWTAFLWPVGGVSGEVGCRAGRRDSGDPAGAKRSASERKTIGYFLGNFGAYSPSIAEMETFLHDLRHSLRMFWQSRGFTAAALAALALGIGANTAVFSVVNTVLLKPVPFPDPDRIVMLGASAPGGNNMAASPAKFEHWKEQTGVLEDVVAFRAGVLNLTGGAFPEQLKSDQVSADYFRLFGAPVVRGRTFTALEDLP
jgi:MacB-like periplasmic core domain